MTPDFRAAGVSYLVTYRFTPAATAGAAGAMPIYGQGGTTRSDYLRLRIGETLDVIYRPDEPEVNALALSLSTLLARPYRQLLSAFAGLAAVVAIVGGLTMAARLAEWWLHDRLIARGVPAPARLVGKRWTGTRRAGSTVSTYRFVDQHGHGVTAQSAARMDRPHT